MLNRRRFLGLSGAAGLSALMGPSLHSLAPAAQDFTFLFITDNHLQPELNAAQGCDQCFKKARAIKSDFVLQGGDHVFDALEVNRSRATSVFDLYAKTEQDLGLRVYHT